VPHFPFPFRFSHLHALLAIVLLCLCHAGRADEAIPAAELAAPPAPIRFLLTFDDGPANAEDGNPTARILDALAANPVQAGIKAIFFTQVGSMNDIQRQLLQREHDDGHLLAFHTATPGHANHRYLEPQELAASLRDGGAALQAVSGTPTMLVRPPYWSYDARTLAAYRDHGMAMLLTDLSANDGKIHGVNWSWRKRQNLLTQMTTLRVDWQAGKLSAVDGSTPVVVTFHDLNTYTARHIEEYLAILQEVAQTLQMPSASRPFYDERGALLRAALARTVHEGDPRPVLPGLWNWIWN
jgi:peptidoglycan/xylan/chitin deacetylase (PgdA/CDA1 family)